MHSNGFRLVRQLLEEHAIDLTSNFIGEGGGVGLCITPGEGFGPCYDPRSTVGDVLLTPTAIYSPVLHDLGHAGGVHAAAHITGGGFPDNVGRAVPDDLAAVIDLESWTPQPALRLAARARRRAAGAAQDLQLRPRHGRWPWTAAHADKNLAVIEKADFAARVVGEVVDARPRRRRPLPRGAPHMKPVDLIGCGALNLDLIYRLPRTFPLWDELAPPGTEQLMDASVRKAVDEALAHVDPVRAGGGQAANTVYALARLGYGAAMVGRVGADEDGGFLLAELAPADARLVHREGETGRVYVLLDEDGERRNLVWPAANDAFSAGRPAQAPAARPLRPLHAASSATRRSRPSWGCSSGCPPTSTSPSTPARSTPARASSASCRSCSAAPTCSPPRRELEMLCGLSLPESLDFLLNAGVGLVIVKMGGRGARLVGRRVDLYVPPLPAEVVDVTGAGDLFAAGFLAAMIEQTGLESAGRLAAWAASRGISGLGRSAYPDATAWRERLAEERGEDEGRRPRRSGR